MPAVGPLLADLHKLPRNVQVPVPARLHEGAHQPAQVPDRRRRQPVADRGERGRHPADAAVG